MERFDRLKETNYVSDLSECCEIICLCNIKAPTYYTVIGLKCSDDAKLSALKFFCQCLKVLLVFVFVYNSRFLIS